jgi:hypothetical protein
MFSIHVRSWCKWGQTYWNTNSFLSFVTRCPQGMKVAKNNLYMTKNKKSVMKMHFRTIVDMATTTLKKVNTLRSKVQWHCSQCSQMSYSWKKPKNTSSFKGNKNCQSWKCDYKVPQHSL